MATLMYAQNIDEVDNFFASVEELEEEPAEN